MATDQTLESYQLSPSVNHPLDADDGSDSGNYPFFQVCQDVEAALRGLSINTQWRIYRGLTGVAFVYVSADVFTMGSVDFTADWRVGTRVQAFVTSGTIYGTITAVQFSGSLMTVTVQWDNGAVLDAGLTQVNLGAVQADGEGAIPSSVLTQNNAPNYCVITNSGSGSAFTGTLAPPILAYKTGATYKFLFTQESQGGDTIALNGLAAVPMTKNGTTPLSFGDIGAGQIAVFDYDGTNMQLSSGLSSSAGGNALPGARNLVGINGSTATQFAITADLVVLRNPSTEQTLIVTAFAPNPSHGVDIATPGPAANGRDQAAGFTPGFPIHIYAIGGGGQTPALIASENGPSGGPTLPASYTSWAYLVTLIIKSVSGEFNTAYLNGNKVTFETATQPLLNGSASTSTSQSFAASVPPQALTVDLQLELSIVGGAGKTLTYATANFGIAAATDGPVIQNSGGGAAAGDINLFDLPWTIPNVNAQTFFYKVAAQSGTSTVVANAFCRGYTVPNAS